MALGSDTPRLVGIVFAVLVSTVLLACCYFLSEDRARQDRAGVQAQQALRDAEHRVQQLAAERQELLELAVGDDVAHDGYDGLLAEGNATFEQITSKGWITQEDLEEIRDPEVRRIWDDMLEQRDDPEHFQSLTQLSSELPKQLRAVLHIVPRLRLDRIGAREEVDRLIARDRELRAELDTDLDKLNADLRSTQDEGQAQARNYDRELALLQGEIGKRQSEMARVHDDHQDEVTRHEAEVAELKRKLAHLIRKAEAGPNDAKRVFVFLGTRPRNDLYDLPELKRSLLETGATVADQVTVETDVVVLLNDDAPGFRAKIDRAATFGVTFMREAELLEHLSKARSPRLRASASSRR